MRTTSWYLPTYDANWGKIANVHSDGLAILEDVCSFLGKNHFLGACENGENAVSTNTAGSIDIQSRGKCITTRITALVHECSSRHERNTPWIRIAH